MRHMPGCVPDLAVLEGDDILPRVQRVYPALRRDGWRLVEHSSYSVPSLVTSTVEQEIQLYCRSNNRTGRRVRAVDVLARWSLAPYAQYRFTELSGGTLKYLLLGLQCNLLPPMARVIVVNLQRELDAEHVQRVVANLQADGARAVYFVEENSSLLIRKLGRRLRRADVLEIEQWASASSGGTPNARDAR